MPDDSLLPFDLPAVRRKKVTAAFDGGLVSSNGGLLLLREAERHSGLAEMLRFRMLAIACGYEDADDCDALRHDPLFKLAVGRAPESGDPLCSRPTMSRQENMASRRQAARLAEVPAPVVGQRLASTWRDEVYPRGGQSLRAAGFVFSKAPTIVRAYAEGAVIRSRHGYFLAIPTPAAGKYGDGRKKITPGGWERRHGAKLRFVFRRGRPSLLVAENLRARTGKRGGLSASRSLRSGKASESALRTGRGLASVPMFILVPQVTVRKRLDVSGAADKWIAELPGLVVRSWREPGGG